ncbi:MAG: universal stress protein [bacterium]|nr:universal stress protein [bacterium]
MYKNALIALDGTKSAEVSIDELIQMAPAVEKVHLLLVEHPIANAFRLEGYIVYSDQIMEARRRSGIEYLESFRKLLEKIGFEVLLSVRFDDSATAIAAVAQETGADLVLLGGAEGGFFTGPAGLSHLAPRVAQKVDAAVVAVQSKKEKKAA